MTIGYLGLGKMGKNMVLRLLEGGIKVVAWNRSPGPVDEVVRAGAVAAAGIADLVARVPAPRVIWLMLPAGEVTESAVLELSACLSPGDILIDGGNSFWKDAVRRRESLMKRGIRFMDAGVSGGPDGARTGACLMVGGQREEFERVLPVLTAAAAPGAIVHTGQAGSGHFAKMVHNGIEYGMMQALAEGADVLAHAPFPYDLGAVFRLYNTRSVIESRLTGWTSEALMENPDLTGVSSVISHTGEAEWTVQTAKESGIPVPVIETALDVRRKSAADGDSFAHRVVTALRGKFGHHEIRPGR